MARNLSIIILETLFTALCVVLVLVNLKYNHGCGGYDPGSATSRRVALERRLEAMEVEARENAALLHEVIMGLEDRFGITKMMDLRELKKECHAEAAEIVAHLAEDHAPPMPVFGDSSPSEGETTFGDDVYKDDVLAEGGGDDRYGEPSGEESPEDDRVVDLPPRKNGARLAESGGPTTPSRRACPGARCPRTYKERGGTTTATSSSRTRSRACSLMRGSTRSGGRASTPRPRAASTTTPTTRATTTWRGTLVARSRQMMIGHVTFYTAILEPYSRTIDL